MSSLALRFGLPVVWIGTTAVAFLTTWARLPDPMASHWGISGLPDGSMSRSGMALLHLIVTAAAGVGMVHALGRPAGADSGVRAGLASTMTFVGTLFATIGTLAVRANVGVGHWRAARPIGVATIVAAVVLPLAFTALVTWLQRRGWRPQSDTFRTAPSVGLGAGERAVWTGSARSHVFAVIGVASAAVAPFWWSALPTGLVFAAAILAPVCLALARIVVRADERGLQIAYGPLGWPRQHVRLDRVVGARAINVVPMANGGWGYRGSLLIFGRAAVILRGGEGLELSLQGGKRLIVTVDDAATGAGLINDLVARAAGAGEQPRPWLL